MAMSKQGSILVEALTNNVLDNFNVTIPNSATMNAGPSVSDGILPDFSMEEMVRQRLAQVANEKMKRDLAASFGQAAFAASSMATSVDSMAKGIAAMAKAQSGATIQPKRAILKAIGGETLQDSKGKEPIYIKDSVGQDDVMNDINANTYIKNMLERQRVKLATRLCVGCFTCPNKNIVTRVDSNHLTRSIEVVTTASCDGNCPSHIIEEQKQTASDITKIARGMWQVTPSWIESVTTKMYARPEMPVVNSKPFEPLPEARIDLTPEEELALLEQSVQIEGLSPVF